MNGLNKQGQITFYTNSIALGLGLLPIVETFYNVSITTQTYTLTGNTTSLLYGHNISITVGTFSLVGNPVTLTYTPLNSGIGITRGSVLAITLNLNL